MQGMITALERPRGCGGLRLAICSREQGPVRRRVDMLGREGREIQVEGLLRAAGKRLHEDPDISSRAVMLQKQHFRQSSWRWPSAHHCWVCLRQAAWRGQAARFLVTLMPAQGITQIIKASNL